MILTALLAILCLALAGLLLREHRRNTRKVNFLLDAVAAGDYTFKFSEDGPAYRSAGINAALNRIARIMQAARTEALEREKYYELIINQVNTGIIVTDAKGNVLQCNREALRLLGMERLTHTRQLSRVGDELEQTVNALQPGEKRRVTFLNERGNVDLQLHASAAVLRGSDVRIVALNDINSEMDDNQLESWNKLIRVLTHEIMNTVTPITSLSETLLGRLSAGGTPPAQQELHDGLEVIHATSAGLVHFVENYRRLTHIPAPQPEPFYVKPFAERMRRICLEQVQTDTVGIELCIDPPDLLVYADERLLTLVVTNLLKNAVQAITGSGEGSRVWLHAYTGTNDAVVIDIANDGPLIPPDVADHIFVPFFTTKTDGSGIGLSVSRQIMKLSGGTLTLKSDNRNHRTTFTLTFL